MPAAEIKRIGLPGDERIRIKGPIEPGDDAAFTALLDIDDLPAGVVIDSPGGDLPTAITIGTVVRRALLPVSANGNCGGGCVLVWVAGVHRTTRAALHIDELVPVSAEVAGYLDRMDLSAATVAGLTDDSPLSPDRAHERFGTADAGHEARLLQECGALDERQQRDWAAIRAQVAVDSSLNAMTTGMGGQSMYVVDPETERLAASARELPADYRRELEEHKRQIDACRRTAVMTWRRAYLDGSGGWISPAAAGDPGLRRTP